MAMQWLWAVLNVLYWLIVYPVIVTLSWLLLLLYWIASPLIYLGHFFVRASLHPIHFLARFETLYIYFGVAVIVGLAAGLILHFLSRTSTRILGLDIQQPRGHSAASYRAEREQKKLEKLEKKWEQESISSARASRLATDPVRRERLQPSSGGRISMPQGSNAPRPRGGLLSTTILEEVESSDEDFGF